MRSIRTVGAVLAVLGVSLSTSLVASPAGATDPPVPPSTAVGPAPSVPRGAHDRGTLADSTPVHLVVTLRPHDSADMQAAVEAVSTPGSPLYRHYLSPEQFGARYGASDAEISTVTKGLRALGLDPGTVAANHLSIPVEATAGQVARALHTPLHSYTTARGRTAYANTRTPSLPSAIADHVRGIVGLDSFPAARSADHAVQRAAPVQQERTGQASPATVTAQGVPVACPAAQNAANTYGGATPADLLSAYSATSLLAQGFSGGGQNLAILSLEKMSTSDVNVFRDCYGATGTVTTIQIDGGAGFPSDETTEATLDVETMLGLAPSANISFYEAPNTDAGWYDAIAAIVAANTSHAISVSWGLCEAVLQGDTVGAGGDSLIGAEADLLAQAALQGQSFFASAGDTGSADCYPMGPGSPDPALAVSDPASQPYAVAVGGTSLQSTTAPPVETVWNDSYGAGGGGISMYWFRPPYQSGVTAGYDPDGSVCGNSGSYCRTVPDVSSSADPAVGALTIYTGGRWVPVGGTSLAAPTWASLVADMNSSCPSTNGFGMLDFTLYQLPASDFNDITAGNNDYRSLNGGRYAAGVGYDLASGLGTPIVSNLVTPLCAHSATLSANASFVLAAYVDFTGSVPLQDPSDPIDNWVAQLDAGQPRTALLNALANSNAWIAHIVTGFYQNTLGRAPDAGGLAYWENAIRSRQMTVAQVAANFYSSAEYYGRDSNNATTWVTDLYAKLLERTPDSAGLMYWVSRTASKGRTWVAYQFYQSNESCRDRVANLYHALLHRSPDPGGQAYWAGVVVTRGDIALAVNLASSAEYYALAAKRFPGP